MPIKRIILTVIFVVALLPSVKSAFLWQNDAILQGEIWRIITGHMAHTNYWHALSNILAFWYITLIFTTLPWLRLSLLLSLGIGIGLFFTDIERYVGFSGVLYGLFFYATTREKNVILIVMGISKLIWDQWIGLGDVWNEWIQAPVALQAHWIGATFGITLALAHSKIR